MDDTEMQRFLVEALSAAPFNMAVTTLADLHARAEEPAELRQMVCAVLRQVDPLDRRHRADARDEAAEATAVRVSEALVLLNYRPVGDPAGLAAFNEAFLGRQGARQAAAAVFPLLHWLLSRLPDLKKRAYVARFLRPAAVPEQYFADEAMVEQYGLYRELQAEFVEVHKALGREERVDPVRLQRDIEQLDLEKGQLAAKMERLRERVRADAEHGPVPFDELLRSTRALRTEQEEEARLMDSLEEQRHLFFVSEQRREAARAELDELRRPGGPGGQGAEEPAQLLARLRGEVAALEEAAGAAGGEEEAREAQLRELQAAATGDPMTEADVAGLEHEVADLERRVEDLTAERDRVQSSMDGQVGFYRDRATAVEKKRERLEERVRELEEELREAERDLRAADEELRRAGGGTLPGGARRPQTDAEVKEYMRALTDKTERYKRARASLQALVNENRVLQHTEEVLRARDANIQDFNRELEARHGVEGFQAAQDTLEKVSADKSSLDKEKGAALADMSRLVDEFHRTVRAKKEQLAPCIKEFREARAEYREVEREYLERKREHDTTAAGLDAGRIDLEREVQAHRDALHAEESAYHFLTSVRCVNEARLRMLEDEERYQQGADRLDGEHATYADLFKAETRRHEELSRTLRKEQKAVKRDHGGNVEQRRQFKNLRLLLQAKADARARARVEPEMGLGVVNEGHDFIQFGDA